MKKSILIISGPTASGKSALALSVAKEIADKKKSIIINADSVQLYKDLPILSSQPSTKDLSSNQHLLYGILEPNKSFSVKDWIGLATKEIDKALANNILPILVGGTGLYLSKLVDGISEVPAIEQESKEYCQNILDSLGQEGLIKELNDLGDNKNITQSLDKQRLLRRLEVLKQTGQTLSEWQSKNLKKFYKEDQFIHINISPDREILYRNCNDRFHKMLDSGAIEEVRSLVGLGIGQDSAIAKTIGFLEIQDYLNDKIDKTQLIEKASQKTRNYAKRQLTWFRNQFQNKIEIQKVSRETINYILNLL